jgi:hypothetical protein
MVLSAGEYRSTEEIQLQQRFRVWVINGLVQLLARALRKLERRVPVSIQGRWHYAGQ